MPVKKCKLSLFIKLYLLSVYLTWKFVVNGHFNYQQDSMAIFSDNLLSDFETFIDFSNQNNHLSFNGSNFQRFDSNASSLCGNTLAQMIASNNNYAINAIESKRKYLSCENLIELICNPLIDKKLIVTHSVFDCDEYIKMAQMQQNVSFSNLIRVVSLSPSIRQIQVVLTGLMNRFSILNYAIIYSNSTQNDFYKSLAGYLLFKFSIDSKFTLEFSLPIEDSKIGLLLKDNVKILFLIVRCGEDETFMELYWQIIKQFRINTVAIYSSPNCLPLLNFNSPIQDPNKKSAYFYFYKLIPMDSDNNNQNYANYSELLLNMLKPNQSVTASFPYFLDENENINFIKKFNESNEIFFDTLNHRVKIRCYQNIDTIHLEVFQYCYRDLYFEMFGLSQATNLYSQVANFYITNSILDLNTNGFEVEINMPQNLTFRYQGNSESLDETPNDGIFKDVLFGVVGMVVFVIIVCVVAYIARSRLMRKELSKGPNKILLLPEDLDFVGTASSKVTLDTTKSNISLKSGEERIAQQKTIKIAKYKGDLVIVKFLKIPNFQIKNSTMRDLRMLRDLRHENLNSFLGCFMDVKTPALIYDYANRGSLQDIILKKDIKLDWNFKWSMLNDLCRGMRYIHHSSIKYHGNLKSRNCVVDSRWVLKLTDFGLPNVYSNQNFSRTLNLSDLLWTAPEHLRQTTIRDQVIISIGSQTGDIYSFGIIMQEVIVRGTPFCMMGLSEEEIIGKIRKPPPLLRPSVSKTAAPPEYVNIMRDCWSEQPELRPSFDQLASMFKSLNGEKKVNIVDLMFKMIEQYTNNLEELVREKTEKLEEEKKKFEKLLSEMLPKTVAESLMSGESVPPEQFDMVTIYFSDIVGFTTISAFSSPIEVVTLLNDLYTMFDETINEFDVYKVETIGDAYMVVSGLPLRNGNKHAGEIATMALNLLHNCGKFEIRHLPGIPLRLRIGLHSGACVTGVVGLKMPRYCLFGDTVNTASRMESTSQAYRIHVSESCADILDQIGGYHLEFRGVTELKGKGMHKTFWLTGKDGFEKQLPEPFISEKNHGVDDQLIEQIKKIVAERQVQKLNEDVHQNEAKINSVPMISADANDQADKEEQIKIKTDKDNVNVAAINKTRNNLKNILVKHLSQEKETVEIGKNRIFTGKTTKFNKNDSGFCETNHLSASNAHKKNSIDVKRDTHSNTSNNKISPLPDIDSIV